MAITLTTPAVPSELGPGKEAFIVAATSADASGCEVIKAAPGAGKSIFITHLTLNNGASVLTHTIGEGEAVPGTLDTNLLPPLAMAANTSLQWTFNPPLKLTANTLFAIDSSGAGVVSVIVQGFVSPT